LEEPGVGLDLEFEAVGRGRPVRAGDVALRNAVAKHDEAAGLVRRLRAGVCLEVAADLLRDHHQTVRSIDSSTSSFDASQNPAERYFQPPSARTQATTASSPSSPARRSATWRTAPAETPAKMPSRSM